MSRLRTIGLVAGFDLYESLRSKKALGLILLYVLMALGTTAAFSRAYNEVFAQLSDQLGAKAVDKILESEEVVRLMTRLTGNDEALARELLRLPPLALFYEWTITTFMPFIVILSSTDAISGEISSGSARFALFRVDRFGWAYGKLMGQLLLMLLGIALGALASWGMGMASLDRIDAGASLYWLLRMSFRGAFYGFAWLGIALCASQLVRSNFAARGLGLVFLFTIGVSAWLFGLPGLQRKAPFFETLRKIFPAGHGTALFRPELSDRLIGMVSLLVIGLVWFNIGFWRLSRRDT